MSGFLSRLIDRHLTPGNLVSPQTRGRYEPESSFPMGNTGQYPFEKRVMNIESEDDHLVRGEEQNRNPIGSRSNDNSLPGADELIPPFINKPEHNSGVQDTFDIKSIKGIISELHSDPNAKREDAGDRVGDPRIKHNPGLSNDQNQEEPGEVRKIISKGANKLIGNPATSDFNIDQPIKKGNKSESNSSRIDGLLRPAPLLSDWKSAGNQFTEIKSTQAPSTPTIKVTIGRIEVRAVMQPVHSSPQQTESTRPNPSLEDYLNKGNKEQR